ncbi:hypothetical protein OG760_28270 [Streptomyces sp. NBC_00963]|nr:hypothetical protein [Streptomyces sp. NBC_01306]MCX4723221.1 hypothetical protein [Streptomyces sp. NBC_01306]WSX45274.1 hypothetical protein OG760_28270 [Streptomyces sp. NBC_00963]
MTVDPSLVIGGGGVSRAGDNIIKPVRRSAGTWPICACSRRN